MSWWLRAAIMSPALYVSGFVYPQSEPAHAFFQVLVVGLAVCTLGGAGLSRAWLNQPTRHAGSIPAASTIYILLHLWAVCVVVTALLSSSPAATFFSTHNRGEGAFQHLIYIAFFALLLQVPDRDELPKWLVYLGCAVCAYAVFPQAWLWSVYPPRLMGSLGNPLFLATLLIFAIWGALKKRWWHLALVFLVALAATAGKGAILGVVAGLIFWQAHTYRLGWSLLTSTGLIVGLWSLPMPASGSVRLGLWTVGWKGVLARPWGWGAENFPLVWDRFYQVTMQQPAPGETLGHIQNWHDRAHNMYLDRALDWGVPGLLIFLAILVYAYHRGGPLEKAALTAYGVSAMFMFDTQGPMIGLLVLVAYCLHTRRSIQAPNGDLYVEKLPPISGWRLAVGVPLIVGTFAVVALSLYQSSLISHATSFTHLRRAIAVPSPTGGFGAEATVFALQKANGNLDFVREMEVPAGGPLRTTVLYLRAVWLGGDDQPCQELLEWAPNRADARAMCRWRHLTSASK